MSLRVLIVEDEALIALDVALQMEDLGHEVVATVGDADAALDAARDGIDLALVDVTLRDGATGPGLGETLSRAHGATVIYLTADPRRVSADAAGPVGILPKPCTGEALGRAVRFAESLRAGRPALPPVELRLLLGAAPAIERGGRQAHL